LDRIDIHIDVPAVKFRELRGEAPETDSSAVIRQRVIEARERQHRRFASEKIFSEAAMTPRVISAALRSIRIARRCGECNAKAVRIYM